jgi:hypothetical protein
MHLAYITFASRTHLNEVSPRGSIRERCVDPELIKAHVEHTGASHKRPCPCIPILSTNVKARANPAELKMFMMSDW